MKKEVDYILADKKALFWNVEVVPLFSTGSDHRLLQAHVHIRVLNTGKTRISSHTTKKSRSIDGSLLEESLSCATLQNKNDIDAAYLFFVDTLKGAVERAKTCGPGINKSRISEETKQSMQRRRELKRDGSHNVEYSIICKLIRSKVKEDVEIFRQERLLKAAEERRSTKKCERDLLLYRNFRGNERLPKVLISEV
ncbi:hypothetical protein Y032_0549g3289 [Ancylostoma ceylanicum]|uniref:Endonuclease/exonuclease/phosphatase domain-containing protein n=1 Tax=Ancylostoma ceylanicum TaxID=53326 RepID=A0A016WQ89_9BILA|nr:hypothetical protein Y032_0549g3289 [Ancylostoma ceylanicum]